MTFDETARDLERLAGRFAHVAAYSRDGNPLFEIHDAIGAVKVRDQLVYVTLASAESAVIIRRQAFVNAEWAERSDPIHERVLSIELEPLRWEFVLTTRTIAE